MQTRGAETVSKKEAAYATHPGVPATVRRNTRGTRISSVAQVLHHIPVPCHECGKLPYVTLRFVTPVPGLFCVYVASWYLIDTGALTAKSWVHYASLLWSVATRTWAVIRFFLGAFTFLAKLCRPATKESDFFEETVGGHLKDDDDLKEGAALREEKQSFSDEKTADFIDPQCGKCGLCTENPRCPMKVWRELCFALRCIRPLHVCSLIAGVGVLFFNVMLVVLPGNTVPNEDINDSVLRSLIRFAPPWSVLTYIVMQMVFVILTTGLLQREARRIPSGTTSLQSAPTFVLHITIIFLLFALTIASISISESAMIWSELSRRSFIEGPAFWTSLMIVLWLAMIPAVWGLFSSARSLLRQRKTLHDERKRVRPSFSSPTKDMPNMSGDSALVSPRTRNGEGSWIFGTGLGDRNADESGCGCCCCAPDGKFRICRDSPETRATWWSFLTFTWISPLISLGHSRTLEFHDLYNLPSDVESVRLQQRFQAVWDKERESKNENASLVRVILKFGKASLSLAAGLKFVYDSLNLLGPMLLNLLIKYLGKCSWALYAPDKSEERTFAGTLLLEGLGIIGLLTVSNFVQTLILHQYFRLQFRLGIQTRSALIATIYAKSLRVAFTAPTSSEPFSTGEENDKRPQTEEHTGSKQRRRWWSWCQRNKSAGSLGKETTVLKDATTTGEIVNLMAVDGERVLDCMPWLHILWSSPYQIIVSLVLLWIQLGPSMLAGFSVMCIGIPLTAKIATIIKRQQMGLMAIRDERIKITNEVFSGIKILKVYAWEESFKNKIDGIREEELRRLWKNQLLVMVQRIMWTCIPTVVSFVSFITYVAVGNTLTAANAFTSIALFNLLRFPLSVLPNVVSACTQGWVSCIRLKNFFMRPEVKPPLQVPATPMTASEIPTITAENLTLRWPNGAPLLSRLSFVCRPGTVTAVIGKTGTGKSGLLSAIIGDLQPESTTFDGNDQSSLLVRGRVAYVSQTAWIQNATLRDNILFGRPYNARWYRKVIKACALKDDLAILPDRDMTEIGEKGVNLSGGQKQRVSLARATYQSGMFPLTNPEDLPADIYVLDDCLSAVDSNVGQHIFTQCILGILREQKRTVIMATHKIDILHQADQVIFLGRDATEERDTVKPGYSIAIGAVDTMKDLPAYADFTKEAEIRAAQTTEDQQPAGTSTVANATSTPFSTDTGAQQALSLAKEIHRAESLGSFVYSPSFSREGDVAAMESMFPTTNVGSYGSEAHEPTGTTTAARHKLSDTDSIATYVSKPNKTDMSRHGIIEEESTERGAVSADVYWSYFQGVGGAPVLFCVITGLLLSQASSVASNFWLSYWSDHADTVEGIPTGVSVYTGLGVLQIIIFSVASYFVIWASQRASHHFHRRLLARILRAPMSFFDSTPVGRLINRFSKDLYTIDQVLPMTMNTYIVNVFTVLATFLVIIIALPWFSVVCLPLLALYLTVQNYYIPCTRQIQRMDSVLRSPLFAHFSETLDGVATIRAYRAQQRFYQLNSLKLDSQQRAYYLLVSANRWLAVRLESVGTLVVSFASLLAVFGGLTNTLSAGLGGLAVSYALNVTQSLNWMVRMASDRESHIVSVERVEKYSSTTPVEAPLRIPAKAPPHTWPEKGHLCFDGYSLRYRPHLPFVLDSLSFEILPQEKIGVVGRTGAGKSSLMMGLLRLVEPAAGNIVVDSVNIQDIGLHDLRSKLSIIPQDPVLFTGTLRFNLDPFDRHTDADVWTALERAHLKPFVTTEFEGGLLGPVEEGGRNVSVGQRQLICLARALLRHSKILLLDEATSAVDPLTDRLIQQTIREEFKDCTVLTVAHRLGTVLDYNRILVLDYGKIVEYGPPSDLMKKNNGVFRSLCIHAGIPVDAASSEMTA